MKGTYLWLAIAGPRLVVPLLAGAIGALVVLGHIGPEAGAACLAALGVGPKP